MIDSSMLPDFIIEAAEHLEEMESSLLRLEQHHEDKEVLDEIFRSIHTIKGAAQFVGIDRVSELSHKFENLLDLIRRGELPLSGTITDLLIAGKDRITLLVDELERTQIEETEVDDLVEQIKNVVEGGDATSEPEVEAEESPLDTEGKAGTGVEEPQLGSLAEESMTEEYDEELYNIFLQQLKENIPFLYAQSVELSISVDKQDVLYRCSDSIKSLKSSANYMGYEKLTQHYSNWQHAIENAVDQLSSGKMPDLAFMQDYIDEIIRSFPQAMDGYSQEEVESVPDDSSRQSSIDTALNSIFSDDGPTTGQDDQDSQGIDLDKALDSIFSDELSDTKENEDEPVAVHFDRESVVEDAPAILVSQDPATSSSVETTAGSDIKPISLEYEASGDEYDQELVDIFLKKLKTDIHFIQEQCAELETAVDKKSVLDRCDDAIGRLAASANYMEYLSLTAYCQNWQRLIADYTAGLSVGLTPDFSGMKAFIDEVIRVYPQIDDGEPQKDSQEPPIRKPQKEAVVEDDAFKENAADVANLLSDSSEDTAEESAEGTAEEDKVLFDTLSNALETSIDNESDYSSESMDSVINGIIDSSEQDGEKEDTATLNQDDATAEESSLEFDIMAKVAALDVFDDSADEEAVEPELEDVRDAEEEAPEEPEDAEELQAAESEVDEKLEKQAQEAPESPGKKMPARSSIRVDAEKIDYLMNQVGELVVSRAYFAQLVNEMKGLQQQLLERTGLAKSELKPLHEFAFRLSEAGVHLGRVSNELQEGVMKVRMLPIDQLFKRYPRLIRDLIHKTDKDVRLVTKGEDTELDKMVIESISDPLIHIIRNSVDHGIETVEERLRAGKPAQGTLLLEAFHESDHIVLEITDDGRGLDLQRIKAKALDKGMFREDELERMSDLELTRLVMLPGFSTAVKTTKTSGRGVGMDVVKKNIEKLNGTVDIVSEAGKGTRLRIKIPLTMAIIQALMVRVGLEKFTIPLTTVEETLRVFRHEISEIEGVDVIYLREKTMPIFRLSRIYNINKVVQDDEKMFVVVVSTGTQELGLVVDELLGQEEVVIKPLADYLRVESGFSGATILGDGGISLILDIPELVKIATENQAIRQEERSLSHKRKWKSRMSEAARTVH